MPIPRASKLCAAFSRSDFLSIGRSRHVTYRYYSLRRCVKHISRTPVPNLALKPEVTFCVQGVMMPALRRSTVGLMNTPVFEVSCFQHAPYQTEELVVVDLVRQQFK